IVLSISTSPAATCFCSPSPFSFFFFFNAPAPTDIYTLSLHDALPISHLAYWQLLVPLVLTGLGFSAAIPAAQSSVLSHIAPQNIGKASGTFTMVRQLGGALGIALAVAMFAGQGSYASPQAFSAGYGPALGICAALAGAPAALLAPTRPGTSQPPAPPAAASRHQTQVQSPQTR